MFHYTIGIAGHIDHGKTTLTKALTGIETDRLREEKEREISIETGFAHFTLPNGESVGVVDVPGHERFIRQMIAGVAGIDLVLLVVAANEGVMPQTREHLDILDLLGVKKGIVVITKMDQVESDFISLVEAEIADVVQHTFLRFAPVISVSAKTGVGIDALIEQITSQLATIPARQSEEMFRLPIDRSFTVKGVGTVITGTIFEGKVKVGDQLRLLPQNELVRVRGLQVHHQAVQEAYAGQRTAINLSGMLHHQIKRGDVLLAPEFLEQSERIDISVQLLTSVETTLKHRSRVAVYTGTAEVEGMILFFDRTELQPGESTYAQLLVDEPLIVKRDDPILLRRPTPTLTLGGGRVVVPYGKKYPFRAETVERLLHLHQATIAELILHSLHEQEKSIIEIQNELTISWKVLQPHIEDLIYRGEVIVLTNHERDDIRMQIALVQYLVDCKDRLMHTLEEYHQKYPMHNGMKRSECKEQLLNWSEELFDWIVQACVEEGCLRINGERLIVAHFAPKLPGPLQQKGEQLLTLLEREGREVSDWLTLATQVGLSPKQAEEIRRYYIEQGVLMNMSEKWVWTTKLWTESIQLLRRRCGDTITIADVKETLGLSRKYIIPILEMMDKLGITKREGDVRVWKIS